MKLPYSPFDGKLSDGSTGIMAVVQNSNQQLNLSYGSTTYEGMSIQFI